MSIDGLKHVTEMTLILKVLTFDFIPIYVLKPEAKFLLLCIHQFCFVASHNCIFFFLTVQLLLFGVTAEFK